MYENNDPIENLVHLYVDGAFNRRELITRLARHTGSIAAAMAVMQSMGVAQTQPAAACPEGIKVPADAPDLDTSDVQYSGDAGTLYGYLAQPRSNRTNTWPGVIVIHENQGLVDHHKDVARRAARAGFVALAVDLLSRQGGTQQFSDPVQRTQAYGRTTQPQRLADLYSSMTFIKSQRSVQWDRIGAVGFCAGGGNCFDLAAGADDLSAAVVFYGAPPTSLDLLDNLKAPLLGIYAELDRTLTGRVPATITGMLDRRKTFGIHIYQGVNHGFHNDTGAAYDPAAACDAWARTIAWFDKHLRQKKAA